MNNQSPGISVLNIHTEEFPPLTISVAHMVDSPFLTRVRIGGSSAIQPQSPRSEPRLMDRNAASVPRVIEVPLIYAVDDAPDMTELYAVFLESAGCIVRTFNNRVEALTALQEDRMKPDLLITDYLGHAMSPHLFLERCRVAHPPLQILMASGCCPTGVTSSHARPDRFLQKPFTADKLRREVREALYVLRSAPNNRRLFLPQAQPG